MNKIKKSLIISSILILFSNKTFATTTASYTVKESSGIGKFVLLMIAIVLVGLVLYLSYKLDKKDVAKERKNKIITNKVKNNVYGFELEKKVDEVKENNEFNNSDFDVENTDLYKIDINDAILDEELENELLQEVYEETIENTDEQEEYKIEPNESLNEFTNIFNTKLNKEEIDYEDDDILNDLEETVQKANANIRRFTRKLTPNNDQRELNAARRLEKNKQRNARFKKIKEENPNAKIYTRRKFLEETIEDDDDYEEIDIDQFTEEIEKAPKARFTRKKSSKSFLRNKKNDETTMIEETQDDELDIKEMLKISLNESDMISEENDFEEIPEKEEYEEVVESVNEVKKDINEAETEEKEAVEEIIVNKPKRGRPKKGEEKNAPKKRGRPAKPKVQTEPKKRGRPKKGEEKNAPKRRGRPPKNK